MANVLRRHSPSRPGAGASLSLVTASLSLFGQAGRSCDTDLDCETTDETGRMGSCTCKARCIHLGSMSGGAPKLVLAGVVGQR